MFTGSLVVMKPFILVKVRASSQYSACKIEDTEYKRVILFKIPPEIRRELESWRSRLSQELKHRGIYWKTLGVTLYPHSSKDKIVEIVSSFEKEYYKIIDEIEDDSIRSKFRFSVIHGQFLPLQPYFSKFISQFLNDALTTLKRQVEVLRTKVGVQDAFISLVRSVEEALMDVENKRLDSIFSWGRENIILFSNLLALLVYAPLEAKQIRSLRADLTKLRGFILDLIPGLCSVLDLTISLISKAEVEGNLSQEEILENLEALAI